MPETQTPSSQVLVFTEKDKDTFISQLMTWLRDEQRCQIEWSDFDKLERALPEVPPWKLILINCKTDLHQKQVLAQFKKLKKQAWTGFWQVLAFGYETAPAGLAAFACQSVSFNQLALRGLKTKIEQHLLLLDRIRKGQVPAQAQEYWQGVNSSEAFEVLWQKPAPSDENAWLLPVEKSIFFDESSWLFSLYGPQEDQGQWIDVDPDAPKNHAQMSLWEWKPFAAAAPGASKGPAQNAERNSQRDSQRDTERWFFRGREPEFRKTGWVFRSPSPCLFRQSEDGRRTYQVNHTSGARIEIIPHFNYPMERLSRLMQRASEYVEDKAAFFVCTDAEARPQPVQDEIEIVQYLQTACGRKEPIVLWPKSHPQCRLNARADAYDPQTQAVTLSLNAEAETDTFFKFLTTLKDPVIFANFNLSMGAIFFDVQKLSRSPDGKNAVVSTQSSFFRLQRRRHTRFSVSTVMPPAEVAIFDSNRPLLNLSIGGFAFCGTPEETAKLKVMDVITIELNLSSKKIRSKGEVRWIRMAKDPVKGEHLQIGVKFLEIRSLQEESIAYFIVDHMLEQQT